MILCRVCNEPTDPVLGRVGWDVHPNCAPGQPTEDDEGTARRILAVTLHPTPVGAREPQTSPASSGGDPTEHNRFRQGELL